MPLPQNQLKWQEILKVQERRTTSVGRLKHRQQLKFDDEALDNPQYVEEQITQVLAGVY